MKTKHILTVLLYATLSSSPLAAEVLFESDFDTSLAKAGTPPKIYAHADSIVRVISGGNDAAAATATQPGNMAMLLQGGAQPEHSWKPAFEVRIPDQSTGNLCISFMLKNASMDIGTLGLQVAKNTDGLEYNLYQNMIVYPNYVAVSGTGRNLFKGITSGAGASWHRFVWTIPLPGKTGAQPTLLVDGQDQGAIRMEVKSPVQSVNTIRFWLTSKRTADIKFLVDDIKVEVIPDPVGYN